MYKGPAEIIEDNFRRVVGIEFGRGSISVEGELICCFNKQSPVLFDQYYHVAGGEEGERKSGNPKF